MKQIAKMDNKDNQELIPVKVTFETLPQLLEERLITVAEAGKFLNLSETDIKFAEVYLTEFGGDGLAAVENVYNLDLKNRTQYTQARQIADRLLSNPDIITLITAQLNRKGLNDTQVDKVLLSLVLQSDDKKVQLAAVREYNDLTGRLKRIEDQQTKKVFDYSLLTNEELLQLIQLLEKCVVNSSTSNMKSVYTPDLEIEDKL